MTSSTRGEGAVISDQRLINMHHSLLQIPNFPHSSLLTPHP
ncbi:hypothetical protein [Chroococcidiopsis sp.]